MENIYNPYDQFDVYDPYGDTNGVGTYISLTALARLLGVNKQVLHRRTKRPGAPKSFRVGRFRYFNRHEALNSLVLRLP